MNAALVSFILACSMLDVALCWDSVRGLDRAHVNAALSKRSATDNVYHINIHPLLIPTNTVEIYEDTGLPWHTWVKFATDCSDGASPDRQTKRRAGCPLKSTGLLSYQSLGFSHTMTELQGHPKMGYWVGAFKTESVARPHSVKYRITGVPEACGRLILSKVVHSFLSLNKNNDVPIVVDYELHRAAIDAESKLNVVRHAKTKLKAVVKFWNSLSKVAAAATESETTAAATTTTTTTTTSRLDLRSSIKKAVCWTFTERYVSALKNWQAYINKEELGLNLLCDNPIASASTHYFELKLVPETIIATAPNPDSICSHEHGEDAIFAEEKCRGHATAPGCVEEEVAKDYSVRLRRALVSKSTDTPSVGAFCDPFSFLLVDNRPAFPLPPQLRGLPLETDEERVYAAAATPDQGYLDVFGSNPNPYYQRTLLDYAKTWLHPIVECTKKHARNCPKNPTILDIIENGGNAQGYYADRPTIDIVFVGDLQPHRQRKGSTKRRDVQIEVEHAVRTDIASRAELFVLNMEAAVIGPAEIISKVPLVLEKRVQRIIRFLTNPVEGLGLSPSSVVINIANNHALDGKSRTSAKTTEAYLREAGFVVIGFRPIQNKKLSGKEMVVVVEVPVGSGDGSGGTAERSHAHKIGFVGWTNVMNFDPSVNNPSCKPGVHANEFKLDILTGPCQLLHIDWHQVKKELGLSLLIGTPHWGIENIAFPEMKDIEIGQTLIDRGFDMIAGSGPHLLQSPFLHERNQNKYPIFPSLGNFVPSGATGGPALCGGAFAVKLGVKDSIKDITSKAHAQDAQNAQDACIWQGLTDSFGTASNCLKKSSCQAYCYDAAHKLCRWLNGKCVVHQKRGIKSDVSMLLPLSYEFKPFATLQDGDGNPWIVPLRQGYATADALKMCDAYYDRIFSDNDVGAGGDDAGAGVMEKKKKIEVFRAPPLVRTSNRRDLNQAESIADRTLLGSNF